MENPSTNQSARESKRNMIQLMKNPEHKNLELSRLSVSSNRLASELSSSDDWRQK